MRQPVVNLEALANAPALTLLFIVLTTAGQPRARSALAVSAACASLALAGCGKEGAPAQGVNCDSNYEGACLNPDASDYDCEGGEGDGPEYTGTVRVVGDDPFDLDRDGDGVACDAS